jgi:hypothetical protein
MLDQSGSHAFRRFSFRPSHDIDSDPSSGQSSKASRAEQHRFSCRTSVGATLFASRVVAVADPLTLELLGRYQRWCRHGRTPLFTHQTLLPVSPLSRRRSRHSSERFTALATRPHCSLHFVFCVSARPKRGAGRACFFFKTPPNVSLHALRSTTRPLTHRVLKPPRLLPQRAAILMQTRPGETAFRASRSLSHSAPVLFKLSVSRVMGFLNVFPSTVRSPP